MSEDNIPDIDKEHIQDAWEYLKAHATKEDVEKMADEIRIGFPNMNGEKHIYGFAVNQTIARIFGGGECESLLRIENDFAKYLGYTFQTQLDDLEKEGYPNSIKPLI